MAADISSGVGASGKNYSGTMIALHWLTLLLLTIGFIAIWTIGSFPADIRPTVMKVHQSCGLTVFLLVAARLLSRAVSGVPPLPATVSRLQYLAARAMEFALYGLMVAQPLLGWTMSNSGGRGVSYLGFIDLPMLLSKDQSLHHTLESLHEFCGYSILVLAGIHAAAALYHHYVQRDDVLNAMLPEGLR